MRGKRSASLGLWRAESAESMEQSSGPQLVCGGGRGKCSAFWRAESAENGCEEVGKRDATAPWFWDLVVGLCEGQEILS